MPGCNFWHILISIHAPRTGSDVLRQADHQTSDISIHAPRTGSDAGTAQSLHPQWDFNPRSPHGERRTGNARKQAEKAFQSTLPARGATLFPLHLQGIANISIHAPRTGSDSTPKLQGVQP